MSAPAAAGEAFFAAEAERVALVCRRMADAFAAGGRLLAFGASPAAWSDARHVAVEFVHPVIVGKRALPALALGEDAAAEVEPGDIVLRFGDGLSVEIGGAAWRFAPPAADPFAAQELIETLYHVLWELVHVFLEHRDGGGAGAGAAGFLYPFLESGEGDLDAVTEDVARSVAAKGAEAAALRERTLAENADVLRDAAAALRARLDAGGRVLALGNGGSATDAMDVVADLRAAGRRALDLTEDPAVLTAIANDVGVENVFARQVIAHGRPGDALLAISTSGGSPNVLAALAEGRRRGLLTIALVGYGATVEADHAVVVRSQDIPRIQEAQATAYHALLRLVG